LDIVRIQPVNFTVSLGEYIRATPVFLGHGSEDRMSNMSNCYNLLDIFHTAEAIVEVHKYNGAERDGHWIKEPNELDDLVSIINKLLLVDRPPEVS
jgi:lysophospholipase-2